MNTQSFIAWLTFLKFIQLAKANNGYYYDASTNTYYSSVKIHKPQ